MLRDGKYLPWHLCAIFWKVTALSHAASPLVPDQVHIASSPEPDVLPPSSPLQALEARIVMLINIEILAGFEQELGITGGLLETPCCTKLPHKQPKWLL